MRKLFVLLTVVLVMWIVLHRDRLYLRDPLGHVTREGVMQEGAHVFINYENDVLVQEKNSTGMFVVQHWNRQPAVPGSLACVQGMACLAPADRVVDVAAGASGTATAAMSDRAVSFTDDHQQRVVVTIR